MFDVNVDDLNVDLLSLSAHKIYGPKGIGALYVRSGLELTPMLVGGPQEHSLRAGTENVPGIVGLGAAMDLVRQHRADERARLLELRKYLIDGLQAISPAVIVNGLEEKTASHILSISFVGVDAEMMLIRLNGEGFAVSLGSACNSKSIEPSHVLTAMKLPQEQIESTLADLTGYADHSGRTRPIFQGSCTGIAARDGSIIYCWRQMMEKKTLQDRASLLADVAEMYYLEEKNQAEIAKAVGVDTLNGLAHADRGA